MTITIVTSICFWLFEHKEEMGLSTVAAIMSLLHSKYVGNGGRKIYIESIMSGLFSFGISDFLITFKLPVTLSFMFAIIVGFYGVSPAIEFLKKKIVQWFI